MDNFSFNLKSNMNLNKIISEWSNINPSPIEAHISNRQKHAVALEYGTGIYSDSKTGSKGVIHPRSGKSFIIPVIQRYASKLNDSTLIEANRNAKKYPDIMGRLRGANRNLIGFIFRDQIKGMKPVKMVRSSIPSTKKYVSEQWKSIKTETGFNRQTLVKLINRAAIHWMNLIIKKTPVLTSNLKTGWTISKPAE